MKTCLTCGQLVPEPGVAYGYAGPVCRCLVLPKIQRLAEDCPPSKPADREEGAREFEAPHHTSSNEYRELFSAYQKLEAELKRMRVIYDADAYVEACEERDELKARLASVSDMRDVNLCNLEIWRTKAKGLAAERDQLRARVKELEGELKRAALRRIEKVCDQALGKGEGSGE